MSGSRFLRLLPSGLVDLPESEHTKSFESLPSFFQRKLSLGVFSEAVGSL